LSDLLQTLQERIKGLAGEWTQYSVVISLMLYVTGYLTLRFHLTAMGVGTDLSVLDERYLFTGARFLVFLVASVPIVLLIGLPVGALLWAVRRWRSSSTGETPHEWMIRPATLVTAGIIFAIVAIQFVMRQCFLFNNLLLADRLPSEPSWLVALLLNGSLAPLYFSALVALCLVPLLILVRVRGAEDVSGPARALLVFLAAVQLLLLPVNYGVLIVDKTLPRVASLDGKTPLTAGDTAWLVWEGKDGVTFLVRSGDAARRSLVTLKKDDVARTEIVAFDPILPTLFPGARP
jgi:hypothetical protein